MNPKVKFYIRRPEESINHIMYYLDFEKKQKWNWNEIILGCYPKLKIKLEKEENIQKKEEIVKNFFKNYFNRNEARIKGNRKKFQEIWDKIGDDFMKTLEEVLEIKWPKNDKKIWAILTLSPICPRWIKERTFDVYCRFTLNEMKALAIHEILHFLWFEKWKDIFPKTNEKEFYEPHLVWKLSEMVPKAILSDKRIQKTFKHKPVVYNEWVNAKINRKSLLDYFDKFYNERKDFEDFVKKSWAFIKEHEKEINKI